MFLCSNWTGGLAAEQGQAGFGNRLERSTEVLIFVYPSISKAFLQLGEKFICQWWWWYSN